MAFFEIPTDTVLAHYSEEVDLDGATFTLLFLFNDREGFWYLDIFDLLGARIRSGIKITTGTPLLRLVTLAIRPPGEILAIDATGEDKEAGLGDLGDSVTLTYTEEASLP